MPFISEDYPVLFYIWLLNSNSVIFLYLKNYLKTYLKTESTDLLLLDVALLTARMILLFMTLTGMVHWPISIQDRFHKYRYRYSIIYNDLISLFDQLLP